MVKEKSGEGRKMNEEKIAYEREIYMYIYSFFVIYIYIYIFSLPFVILSVFFLSFIFDIRDFFDRRERWVEERISEPFSQMNYRKNLSIFTKIY